jgi:hypothetical protein
MELMLQSGELGLQLRVGCLSLLSHLLQVLNLLSALPQLC